MSLSLDGGADNSHSNSERNELISVLQKQKDESGLYVDSAILSKVTETTGMTIPDDLFEEVKGKSVNQILSLATEALNAGASERAKQLLAIHEMLSARRLQTIKDQM